MIKWIPTKTVSNGRRCMVVGEAPGETEERLGRPFVGYEGQYLRKLFKAAGGNLDDCFVTNVVQVRPYKNDFSTVSNEDIVAGINELKRDIETWKPDVVLAIGRHALKTLTGYDKITACRGAILPCLLSRDRYIPVIPTIHPGGILRGGERMAVYEPIVIHDIHKALFDPLQIETMHLTVIRNKTEALDLIESLHDCTVVCDIETNNSLMTAFGIATSQEDGYSIVGNVANDVDVLRAISRLMCDTSVKKVFHNALFDCFFLAHYYHILTKPIYFDTMIAQHACYPTLPKSLAFCASIYTSMPYWKGEMQVDLYEYNATDCCVTYIVYNKVQEQLDSLEVRPIFNMMMSMVEPILSSMLRGVAVDMQAVREFAKKNEREIDVLERIVNACVGYSINVRSHKQLSDLIYKQWKLPKQFTGSSLTTTDRKLALLERFPTAYQPLIGAIRRLKKAYKKREFYDIKTDEDGRVRFSMSITGTYTGRLSSSESITGSGRNFFNIPKEVRNFYVADEGKVFIQADLSQAEARVVAALVGDEQWLRAFDEKDIHRENASLIFNVPYDKVTDEQRQLAKKITHGTHYCMSKNLLSELAGIPPKEAEDKMMRYKMSRPKLVEYHNKVRDIVNKTSVRTVVNCFGRKITFFGQPSEEIVRNMVAAIPQSTVADIVNAAVRPIYDLGYLDFVLTVYDSIVVQVDRDVATIKRAIADIRSVLEREINVNGIKFVIPVDVSVGLNLRDLKEPTDEVLLRLAGSGA